MSETQRETRQWHHRTKPVPPVAKTKKTESKEEPEPKKSVEETKAQHFGIVPIKFTNEGKPIEHPSPYITNGFKRVAIVGSSNTGKSYLLGELLPMMHKPGYLIIYSRTIEQQKYQDIMEHYRNMGVTVVSTKSAPDWNKLVNTIKYFNSKGEEVFREHDDKGNALPWKPEKDAKGNVILEAPIAVKQGDLLRRHPSNTIIIDDQSAKVMKSNLDGFILSSRHWNCNCILIYQKWSSIAKDVRENLTDVILFQTLDGYRYLRQTIGEFFETPEDFELVTQYLRDGHDHPYIHLDFTTDVKAFRVKQKMGGLLPRYKTQLDDYMATIASKS